MDDIRKNNCYSDLPAKLAFAYLLYGQGKTPDLSKEGAYVDLERILALLLQYPDVKNHYGIITATFEAIYATKYKDRSGRIKTLSEADYMDTVNNTKVVTNLDGTLG